MRKIYLPLTEEIRESLRAGEEVLLSGKMYTARDAAHKRLYEAIKKHKKLPLDLTDNVIYYCGPTPAKPGAPVGSCGPTTAKRMDGFTPALLASGLAGMIGKGRRSEEVKKAIKRYKAVYLVAVGGAGAYFASKIKKANILAYKELGPEAIYELWVENFPAIVAIDSRGQSIIKE
ncbi:MAG: fumarate hydratase C-terminal domain-containing protein [Candidatus Omnitrophica bacterium]|nr:fumarate hydratase C-terminal domain-containing protein [Candidatus Omnitrophota bacterium]